jgi:hypothetical protein
MNIKEKLQKIKPYENDIILVAVILFVALISFGLGRLSALSERKTPITIENMSANLFEVELPSDDGSSTSNIENRLFVASRNGAKYHYPWCSGAQRIKDSNRIWFATKEEAEKAGYTPAANCKGL